MADDDIAQMIEDCEARDSKLSEWEQQFIDSIGAQLARTGGLSQKQRKRLEEIWNRVT